MPTFGCWQMVLFDGLRMLEVMLLDDLFAQIVADLLHVTVRHFGEISCTGEFWRRQMDREKEIKIV